MARRLVETLAGITDPKIRQILAHIIDIYNAHVNDNDVHFGVITPVDNNPTVTKAIALLADASFTGKTGVEIIVAIADKLNEELTVDNTLHSTSNDTVPSYMSGGG